MIGVAQLLAALVYPNFTRSGGTPYRNQFAVYHFFNLPTIAIRPPTWATSAFNVVCRHLCHLSARPLAIAVEHTVISANLLRRHIGRVTLFVGVEQAVVLPAAISIKATPAHTRPSYSPALRLCR